MRHQEPESDHPLSAAQLRWWVAQQLHPEIPNTVAMYLDLTGPLEVDRMREAGRRAARELRSPCVRVYSVDGRPRQRSPAEAGLEMAVHDLAQCPDPVGAALDRMEHDYLTALDPVTDDLTVATLYRVGTDRHLLYLRSHHLVLDGAGAVALLRRTGELYRAGADGVTAAEPGALGIAEILADEQAYRRSPRSDTDREYWRAQLSNPPEPIGPAGRRTPPCPRPHQVSAVLDHQLADAVAVARTRYSVTFGEVLIAAFSCYLARLTDTTDPVLALPVPARTTAALRRSAGSVSNVVPLRLTEITHGTVADALVRVRRTVFGALRHQRYPYEDIQGDLGGGRVERGGFGPVINVLGFVEPLRAGPLTGQAQLLSLGPVEDLLVNGYQLGPDERTVTVDFQGNPDRYSMATLVWYHRGFLAYLRRFLGAAPDDSVAGLDRAGSVLPTAGVVPDAVAPVDSVRSDDLLPQLLRAGMRAVPPDTTAVDDGTRSLTYRQLDDLAHGWAQVLGACGAGPGVPVAVVVPRSIESVLALWAVATAGACFVPVDPADPPHRVAAVLRAAGARLGLTVAAVRPGLPGSRAAERDLRCDEACGSVRWLELDGRAAAESSTGAPWERRDTESGPATAGTVSARSDPDRAHPEHLVGDPGRAGVSRAGLHPDHPAYLIHTSGTTGAPKGVLVSHRGLGPLTRHIVERYEVGRDSVVLHAHSPAFDAHLLELLAASGAGARVAVAPPGPVSGRQLAELIRAAGVTHLLTTPAVLGTLDPAELPSLRVVVTGGESPAADSVRRWAPRVRLYNGYGPTEATVMTMQSDPMPADEPALIGPALPGVRPLLLDRWLRRVPEGGRGELYLGGPGVALGYLHDCATTAARFVADPAGTGQRVYRTGDLVRADPAGYEYLGRVDRQLTVHGRRVEPAEIEAALTACPGIGQAVVTAMPGTTVTGARLIAHVVAADGHRVDPADTVRRLRTVLPASLVPVAVLPIERLPVTANGKLDRARLPEPVPVRTGRAPETTVQRLVAEQIGRAVGRTDIGLDDDFFVLGGNSLLGVGLVAELAEITGVPVTVRWLYTSPTVADLADRIVGYRGVDAGEGLQTLLPLRRGGPGPPLFCFHSAVPLAWCYAGLSRQIEDSPVYGIQCPVLTCEEPDPDSADTLAERYVREVLRVQPEGPYHLLGWSLGGQLAHAVAVRIRALGREVALLAMLDSVVFPEDVAPPPRPRMRDLLTHLLGAEPDAERAAGLPDLTAAEAAEQLSTVGPGSGLTADQLDRLHRAYICGVEISARYRPQVYDGDLLYFSATRGMTESLDARMWRPYVTGELIEHPVDAEHGQLTDPAAVAVIGPVLARVLARSAEPAGSR